MYQKNDITTVIYNYKRDGRTCSTPNVDIAISRRDESSTIHVETRTGEKVEYSTLVFE